MPGYFIGQRGGGVEEVKTIILQISFHSLAKCSYDFVTSEGEGLRKGITT